MNTPAEMDSVLPCDGYAIEKRIVLTVVMKETVVRLKKEFTPVIWEEDDQIKIRINSSLKNPHKFCKGLKIFIVF